MYFIFLQSTHCIKKTLTVSCTLLCESGDRVKVDKSSFSAYLHAVMLRHHCSEWKLDESYQCKHVLCKNRVRVGSKKIRVRLVAGTTLRGYDLTSIRSEYG